MQEQDPYIGAIEDQVGDAKLVDGAVRFFQWLGTNAPTYCPERRRFLEVAAGAAASVSLAFLADVGRAEAAERPGRPVKEFEGKQYDGWQAYLLGQDLIYGPPINIYPGTGRANDFKRHVRYLHVRNAKIAGVDLAVPRGVPVVPSKGGIGNPSIHKYGNGLFIYHVVDNVFSHVLIYGHLQKFSDNVDTTTKTWRQNLEKHNFNLTSIIGYSGSSGAKSEHLHLGLAKRKPKKIDQYSTVIKWGK